MLQSLQLQTNQPVWLYFEALQEGFLHLQYIVAQGKFILLPFVI
jgi:hypothetical protein